MAYTCMWNYHKKLISQMAPPLHTFISSSDSEAENDVGALSSKNHVELLEDVIKPLSKSKVDADKEVDVSSTWRSKLSNVYI